METYSNTVKEAARNYDLPITIVNKVYWEVNSETVPFYSELERLISNRNDD